MGDPLSISAGVIGILTAAAQISTLLINFTRTSKDAPQIAHAVLMEVDDISSTLSHLQSFLFGNEYSDSSRTQLLQVDQVVTIMSGCVLTFSELERLLDGLKAKGTGILDRAHWARKEKAIGNLVQRLQNHKASLSLVLQVMNGTTMLEAKSSVERLHRMIERCYQEMSSRMGALELRELRLADECPTCRQHESDTSSVRTIKAAPSQISQSELDPTTSRDILTLDFTDILQKSWVYRRNKALDVSCSSLYSRDTCSMTWSCLSDLSLAKVSNISVIGLPISVDEVRNPSRSPQTWSNNAMDVVWPTTSAVELALNTSLSSELPTGGSTPEPPATDIFNDCKKCGEPINDGNPLKLVGKYWHIECFRCITCNTPLDSDADYLFFQDATPICDNCTYECVSCGTEMEAFAMLEHGSLPKSCFKCRNYITENHKYAKTSSGTYFVLQQK